MIYRILIIVSLLCLIHSDGRSDEGTIRVQHQVMRKTKEPYISYKNRNTPDRIQHTHVARPVAKITADPESMKVLNGKESDEYLQSWYEDLTYEIYTQKRIDELLKNQFKTLDDARKNDSNSTSKLLKKVFMLNGIRSPDLGVLDSKTLPDFNAFSNKMANGSWKGKKEYDNEHWLNETIKNMYFYIHGTPLEKDVTIETEAERSKLKQYYLDLVRHTAENDEFRYPYVASFRREYLAFKALAATRKNELSISALEEAFLTTLPAADIAKIDTKAEKLSIQVEKLTSENQLLKNQLKDLEDKLDMLLKKTEDQNK